MSDVDEQLQMLKDCENRESRLSDWERGFIQSLREQTDRGGGISSRQSVVLEEIWNKVT